MRTPARALTVISVLCLVLARSSAAQDRRAPTLDDLLNLVQVSAAEISPDGTRVIYTKSELKKWSDNKRVTSIWIADADGSDPRQLLGSDKDRSPAWSPDGRYVAFLSTRDQPEGAAARDAAGAQIWVLPMSGGEATKLTDLKSAVRAIRWAEDSARILFTADEPVSDAEKQARKEGDDSIFVDEGPNGQTRANFSNLWIASVSDKQTRRLTTGDRIIADFAPSPDGTRVVYISRPNNRRNHQNKAEVFVADIANATSKQLTTNDTPESNLAWSPDGKAVTYVAPHDRTWELAQGNLYIHPVEGGSSTILSGSFPGDIGEYFWAPSGKSIIVSATVKGRGGIHELDLTTGRSRPLAAGDINLSATSSSKDLKRVAGTRSTPAAPGEIAVVDTASGRVTSVTDANPWFKDVAVSQMRPMAWKSKDGLAIEGLLWLPAAYKSGDRIPLLLSIHGGPAGVWSTSFRGINHVYTSLGWAVLEPNVRGSTSYGDTFLKGNTRDIGGGDYQDVMTGVDAVIAQGIGDPNQLAVRGWSYGGILGGWTITQTTRFKAASLGAMVSDWTSEYAMGFNHDVRLWYIGGTPWENPDAYRRQSSSSHIDKVTTPTILLHGEEDDTDTIGQSMIFYQGLKDRGIATRFIRFPREPHGFREPHHIRTRDAEEISWLMKYTRGIEWKAPERKEAPDAAKPTTTTTAERPGGRP